MSIIRKSRLTVLVSLSVTLALISCQDAESERQMSVLRQLASSMPVYSDFRQVISNDDYKTGSAIIILGFSSQAAWDDVIRFYSQTLLAKGWSIASDEERYAMFPKEDRSEVVFRNGEYQIGIKLARENDRGYKFMITYYWERSLFFG